MTIPDDKKPSKPAIKTTTAAHRLDEINKHLKAYPPTAQLKHKDWAAAVEELKLRQDLSGTMVTDDRGIIRQKGEGKLWVRERIHQLLNPGSFREYGSLTSSVTYNEDGTIKDFVPSNNVIAVGEIDEGVTKKKVVVLGDDFTVRGGHADGSVHAKSLWAETYAVNQSMPLIRLLDGSSGGGSVKSYSQMGRTYVPPLTGFRTMVEQLGKVPVCCGLLGPVVGLASIKATVSHFSVMIDGNSQLFSAGPPLVKYATFEDVTKNELGGSQVHGQNGSVDHVVATEQDAFAAIRQFLSYLPSSSAQLPPVLSEFTPPSEATTESLLSIIPRKRTVTYAIRDIINAVLDQGTWFETGSHWGKSVVVGLGRIDGKTVGILSQDCRQVGGTLSERASEKGRRFVDMCETFSIPILSLLDQPGISVGLSAEANATVRSATRFLTAMFQATVPIFTVILRRAFGVAGAGFADVHGPSGNVRVGWVSGDWGSLPLQGGVEAAFKAELDATKTPQERKALLVKLNEMMEAIRSPLRTAEAFGIEEMIDPRQTRQMAVEWIRHNYDTVLPERLQKKVMIDAVAGLRGSYRP
ncbi:propionyl-CoA carboxylase [Meredithblackwellia eburnea MCA 4105]